jgi:hypothetical protein
MISIAIIVPYFGKWPEWIDLFLFSCDQNKSIDYILFTDCEMPIHTYNNVHINSISYNAFCKLVSERLKINFRPNSPYKLCDLKPFYGYIHKTILKSYDFWGFCDIDVVWGDIRSFYNNDLLLKYDVFSTHNDRLSGHLSLFRNNEKYINLCFKISNWQTKLSSQENFILDESDFSKLIFPESKYIGKFYRRIMMKVFGWKLAWVMYYSIFPFAQYLLCFKKRKLYFVEQHTTPILASDGALYKYESETWFYKDGKVFNDRVNKNYIYLHFMIFKKNNIREDFFWKADFYKIGSQYDLSLGVIISKSGIESFK